MCTLGSYGPLRGGGGVEGNGGAGRRRGGGGILFPLQSYFELAQGNIAVC